MDDNLLAVLSANSSTPAAANTNSGGTVGASATNRTSTPANPVLEALTERLIQQGQGISSSSSSQLQATVNEAIAGTQAAGEATAARLQSERSREVAFARDRAGATYTQALESRGGYGTQVAALRELTDTTEKSIRDLDQRYQEAILTNDANTAGQIAQLRMQKLEFQQQQEQNFFQNLMSTANLQQSAIDSMMRTEQFWAGQESQERQFVMGMAQSSYQFEKNLGIQYQELGLKEQELDIARERNAISRAEYALRKKEIEGEKSTTFLKAAVQDRLLKMGQGGVDISSIDVLSFVSEFGAELGASLPGFEIEADELARIVTEAKTAVQGEFIVPTVPTGRVGGLLGEGNLRTGASTIGGLLGDTILGTPAGQPSTASQVDWSQFFSKIAFGPFSR